MPGTWTIENADVREWAAGYRGESFHALLCDPPYHLTEQNASAQSIGDQVRKGCNVEAKEARKGFMGKSWDGGDVAFQPSTWSALAAHLYPGAFLIAFAGSRGYHRQAVAMEDAGLIKHPTIFGWAFGTGFPKATRVKGAKAFAGHRYGLQAIKPAVEPILIFQKPYDGRPVDCITRTGAGALNIDGARIPTASEADRAESERKNRHADFGSIARNNTDVYGGFLKPRAESGNHSLENGRWPSNLVLLDEGAAAALDAQSGELTSGARTERGNSFASGVYGKGRTGGLSGADASDASRFFLRVAEALDEADPINYFAKASRSERDAGCDGLDLRPRVYNGKSDHSAGCAPGSVEDKFTTRPSRNVHPTVKPLALTHYLATLLLPPAEYAPRRLLVPFSGSGSEMIGGILSGWEFVQGVEADQAEGYVEIAEARLKYWSLRSPADLVAKKKTRAAKPKPKAKSTGQPNLFGDPSEKAA